MLSKDINLCIENFNIDKSNYRMKTFDTYTLYTQSDVSKVKFQIKTTASDNVIYIGENFHGNCNIKIAGTGNTVYIGSECKLNDLIINIKGRNIMVLIGDGVTCTANCTIVAGQNSDPKYSNIVIGDDVMMAKSCSIYSSDNHPIYDIESFSRINNGVKDVIIEPHVWLGQNTMITKSIRVGAGSVIAAGAVVTKDVDRFSLYAGVPAKLTKSNIVWSRNEGKLAVNKAKVFVDNFSDISKS